MENSAKSPTDITIKQDKSVVLLKGITEMCD